jgi:hypothetical protein
MGTLRTRAICPRFRGGRGRLARGAPEATEEKKKPGLTDKTGPHIVRRVNEQVKTTAWIHVGRSAVKTSAARTGYDTKLIATDRSTPVNSAELGLGVESDRKGRA